MNNETKLKYEEPKMSIIVFETADIITSSGFEGDLHALTDEEE